MPPCCSAGVGGDAVLEGQVGHALDGLDRRRLVEGEAQRLGVEDLAPVGHHRRAVLRAWASAPPRRSACPRCARVRRRANCWNSLHPQAFSGSTGGGATPACLQHLHVVVEDALLRRRADAVPLALVGGPLLLEGLDEVVRLAQQGVALEAVGDVLQGAGHDVVRVEVAGHLEHVRRGAGGQERLQLVVVGVRLVQVLHPHLGLLAGGTPPAPARWPPSPGRCPRPSSAGARRRRRPASRAAASRPLPADGPQARRPRSAGPRPRQRGAHGAPRPPPPQCLLNLVGLVGHPRAHSLSSLRRPRRGRAPPVPASAGPGDHGGHVHRLAPRRRLDRAEEQGVALEVVLDGGGRRGAPRPASPGTGPRWPRAPRAPGARAAPPTCAAPGPRACSCTRTTSSRSSTTAPPSHSRR